MERREITLLMLALAKGHPYQPVQIQKAMFLVCMKAGNLFNDDSAFSFTPYDYGPFDKEVYEEIGFLEMDGLATIQRNGRWNQYSATEEGIAESRRLIEATPSESVELLQKISDIVRSLSFQDLVSAIYETYPEMRENSVFVGQ